MAPKKDDWTVLYYRLRPAEAETLKGIAKAEERNASDITRLAVRQYLHGGAEKWAEIQAAKKRPNETAEKIAVAIESDADLAEAVFELASVASEHREARSVLLALARLVAAREGPPRRRAKG